MVIDLVLKPRISPGVGPRLAFKDNRSAVRHDQARPDQEGARLADSDLAIVDSDESRSLRGERSFEGRERQCVRGGRVPIARQTLISGLAKTLNNCYLLFNSGGCHGCADPHVDRDRGAHCA